MKRTILIAIALTCGARTGAAQEAPSYARQVRPFLAKYCLECHNAREAKGGLSLETVPAIREGGDGGPVLDAGKPDASRIVLLVEGKDKPAMPPAKAKLHPKKAEIAVLRAWVAAGAKDDSAAIKVAIPDVKPHKPTPAPVQALVYSPAGAPPEMVHPSTLFTARAGALAQVRPDGAAKDLCTLKQGVTALATSPFTDYLAVALGQPGEPSHVELVWTGLKRLHLEQTPIEHRDTILDAAFHPGGKILATCSYDTQIKLTELAIRGKGEPVKESRKGEGGPGKILHTLKEHSDAVYGVAFNPDGSRLASCSADRAVKVWDVAAGKLLYTLGEATDWLYTVAWSPDGKLLAAGGVDKSIRVYSPGPQGAKLLHSVFAHEAPVQKVLFAQDSRTLYSLGQDGVVKAWDVARMAERKVYDRQPETVLCMALRPDGKQLALGRYDGVVVVLDEATGKAPAKPAPPQVKSVTPAAVPRGKTTLVTIAGPGMDRVTRAEWNVPGARVVLRPPMPDRCAADVEVPATTAPGSYPIQLKTDTGESATATLIVDAYAAVPEKDAGDAPATGQAVTLPTTIAGSLDRAGDVDFYRFEVQKGQQLGVLITTAAGAKLEPMLQLTDLAGRVLAEGSAGHLGYTFATAGTHAIAVRDRELRGGPNLGYRLHLGELPVVTAYFPLGLQHGTETEVRVEGVFLGADRTRVKAGAAAVGSKVPVVLTTPRGAPAGSPQLVVGEFPEVTAGPIPVPGTANGTVADYGLANTWAFQARKGERLVVEVNARRLGSRLDSFIEILDHTGRPVPQAVLRCQAKTFVTFRDHDSAGAGIRIDAWSDLATNDYLFVGGELMRILDLPPNPDADCTFYNAAGPRLGFLGTTPTHHALNTPMYKVSIHPPGTTFPPNGFPVFTLFYRNDDGGPGYGRDSRLFFDPPADGEYRVRIRDARGLGGPDFGYRLTIRPPRPGFNVRFNPTAPAIHRGGAASLAIAVDRLDGFTGPIALAFDNLPPGLSAPPTAIDAGTYTTTAAIFAASGAKLDAKAAPVKLAGTAMIDGKPQTQEAVGQAPKLVEPGEIVTATDEAEVALRPGGQVQLTVRIERRAGFKGRVPVEVRGLPHGVHALDIGLNGILVNENETRRTIVIYAEPWVAAGTRPFVVLARSEGKNTEHVARPVLLRVLGK